MRYSVTIDGVTREIDVRDGTGDAPIITVDGASVEADVVIVPGGLSIRMGGHVYDVMSADDGEHVDLAAGPWRTRGTVESDRQRARRERRGGARAEGGDIHAPMPGRVVKILAEVGQRVVAGDPVIVIEAMKMENELRAPRDATVAAIEVGEGDNVEGNTLLVRLGD